MFSKRTLKRKLWVAARSGFLLTALATTLGYAGPLHWMADLFSHFRFQYLVLISLSILLFFFLKTHTWIVLALPFWLLNAWAIAPFYLPLQKESIPGAGIGIVCLNVQGENTQYERVAEYILSKDPQIVILLEVNPSWQLKMDTLLSGYHSALVVPRTDNFGMALYAKTEFDKLQQIQSDATGKPMILAGFSLGDRKVDLLAVHTFPPKGRQWSNWRNQQLQEIATVARRSENEFVLIGDLNSSSFSPHFEQLIEQSLLSDSRKGLGLQVSWPGKWTWISTTLDHVLISPGLVVVNRETGSDVGSDHLPIFVQLAEKTN